MRHCVYLVRVGPYLKLGVSRTTERRVSTLGYDRSTMKPWGRGRSVYDMGYTVELLGVRLGTHAVERYIHKRFDSERISAKSPTYPFEIQKTEWYHAGGDLERTLTPLLVSFADVDRTPALEELWGINPSPKPIPIAKSRYWPWRT